ncbi:TetR/AcrR family transcriptional regulator [Pseudoxanthomonas sp. GW2]|uniref:TetR/AcrR family transcriptional regulator n=1 Tax=Pseudoxanthomonas sp. GW2 TaxID=1211114 RepID=UPI0003826491|nr:TetR/AcrR family transcriptional regulator [Pseudoxanthomonas sp. GW2]
MHAATASAAAGGPPDDARHQRVRDAVRALVAEHGVNVSMDAIAARAGCSKQTLYARYGSKQALMHQVAREGMAATGLPQAPTAATLRRALLDFAEAHLAHLSEPRTLGTARLVTAQAQEFPEEVAAMYQNYAGALLDRLGGWLQQAMRRGLLRHDDPHCAAELLLGMIVGLDFDRQRHLVPHRDTPEARAQWAAFAVDSFLRAFAPPPFRT